VAYVRDKMVMAETAAGPLWQAARAAQTEQDSHDLLYLNVPAWIAPKEATYRIGTEGLTFIPQYVRVEDFVYVTAGAEAKVRAFTFGPVAQDWEDYIGYAGEPLDRETLTEELRRASSVYLTTYDSDTLDFVEAGSVEPSVSEPGTGTALATFGEQLSLLYHEIARTEHGLELELWWSSNQVQDRDITTFVHVYSEDGQLITQADGYPLLGLYPPSHWAPSEIVRDIRYLSVPEAILEGQYTLAVGWYEPETAQRLPAYDGNSQRLPQDALILQPQQ
jgi:hypothetical protein